MTITVHPLTPDRWLDLEAVFGPSGASSGCWCMWWRIGREYRERTGDQKKSSFKRIVRKLFA